MTGFDAGLPFGTYTSASSTRQRRPEVHDDVYDNTNPSGRSSTLEIPPTGRLDEQAELPVNRLVREERGFTLPELLIT